MHPLTNHLFFKKKKKGNKLPSHKCLTLSRVFGIKLGSGVVTSALPSLCSRGDPEVI